MSVLVTGVGFLGGYAVRDLLAHGEDVVLYGYFGGTGGPDGALPELAYLDMLCGGAIRDRATIVVGDVADLPALSKAAERYEVRKIMHFATMLPTAAEAEPYAGTRVNVMGTANVFEVATRLSMDKVVCSSSQCVFGPRSVPRSGIVTDDSVFDPVWAYGAAKLMGEMLARSYADSKGLDITTIRASRVYGFGEHVKLGRGGGSAWLANLLYKPAIGAGPTEVPFGTRSLDFLYVEDLIDGMIAALSFKEPEGAGCYLVTGDYRPVREAVGFVRQLLPTAQITLNEADLDLPRGATMNALVRMDSSRATAAFGYQPRHHMEAGVYETINRNRQLAGLPEIPRPPAADIDCDVRGAGIGVQGSAGNR